MFPSIQPQLPSVVARAAAEGLFRPGQVLEALVVGKTPDGLVALKIGEVVVNAQLPQALPAGTTLQLQVKAGGTSPQLAIVGTPQLPAGPVTPAPPVPVLPLPPVQVVPAGPSAAAPAASAVAQPAVAAPAIAAPPPAGQVATPGPAVVTAAPAASPSAGTVPDMAVPVKAVVQGAAPVVTGSGAAAPVTNVAAAAPPTVPAGPRIDESVQVVANAGARVASSPVAPPQAAVPAQSPAHGPASQVAPAPAPQATAQTSVPSSVVAAQVVVTAPASGAAAASAPPAHAATPHPVMNGSSVPAVTVTGASPTPSATAAAPGQSPAVVSVQPATVMATPSVHAPAAATPPGSGAQVPLAAPAPLPPAGSSTATPAASPPPSASPARPAISVQAPSAPAAPVANAGPTMPSVATGPAPAAGQVVTPPSSPTTPISAAATPMLPAAPEPASPSPLLVAQGAVRQPPSVADLPRPATIAPSVPSAQPAPAPATPAAALAQMVPEAMARQNSIAPLLTALATIVAKPGALPEPVLRAALQVLGQRVPLAANGPTAQVLETAVAKSGIYLEAGLAKGAAPVADMKAGLVALKGALATWLGGNPPPVTAAQQAAPPLRGVPPRVERADPQPLPEMPREAARALHSQADAALSRVKLMQLASLPDADPMRAPMPEVRMELPFLIGHELVMAQLQVTRDGARSKSDGKRGWTMRFAMNFAAAGEVGAEVGLLGRSVSVALWAADHDTHQALEAALPELAPALAGIGLEPGAIRVRALPPEAPRPSSGQYLDSRR